MRSELADSLKRHIQLLKLPVDSFRSEFARLRDPFVLATTESLAASTIAIKSPREERVLKKLAFFVLQFHYKLFESLSTVPASYAKLDNVLNLAAVGHYFYRDSFRSLLLLNGCTSHPNLEDDWRQLLKVRLFQLKEQELRTILAKLYLYCFSFTERLEAIMEHLLLFFPSARSVQVKSFVFNFFNKFETRAIGEALSLKHPGAFSHFKNQQFAQQSTTGSKSVERISQMFPDLSADLIARLFERHNFVEAACIDAILCGDLDTRLTSRLQLLSEKGDVSAAELLNDKSVVLEVRDSILNALAEEESEDEEEWPVERDGTIDKSQLVLYSYASRHPEAFERTARNTPLRRELARSTKLDHEQIEGWWIMLQRNPKKDSLITKYTQFYVNLGNSVSGASS